MIQKPKYDKSTGNFPFSSTHFDDDLFEANSVASSTECTGLVQTEIETDQQANSYAEIYNVPLENFNGDKKKL